MKLFLFIICLACGCATLSEIPLGQDYHFRKTRWGYTQEMVRVSEQGKRLHLKNPSTLIYKHKVKGVNVQIIYTFKENKLRSAGYIILTPVKNPDKIIEQILKEQGEPRSDYETFVHSKAYISTIIDKGAIYAYSGGILSNVLAPRPTPGIVTRGNGIFACIDQNFYKNMLEVDSPLDEMSFYEKLLFGVVKRRLRFIY